MPDVNQDGADELLVGAYNADNGSGEAYLYSVDFTNSVQPIKQVSQQFRLDQNFPNPFNPETTISYHLPSSGYVVVKIFNLRGQEVATLVNGIQDAGDYSIQWHPENLPSGPYFYQMKSGVFSATRKLLVQK
ncbi:T9SS type A sorting domain-containing protein [candidate division KSB1 bacterium]|nr:T9SS type A sorting domain-containing protein [candidate division KSB1 bacterium]